MKTLLLACTLLAVASLAATAQTTPAEAPARGNLYAVEITIGPAWDSSRKPHEQAFFREHSANLKRLRDQGALVLGARYSDKGLVVLQAESEQEARAMMQQDVSVQNGVFKYELHDFIVFYSGNVPARSRRP